MYIIHGREVFTNRIILTMLKAVSQIVYYILMITHLALPCNNFGRKSVAVDGNTIEKVDRYVYLGKTVTQAGDLLPEIKRSVALGRVHTVMEKHGKKSCHGK